MAVLTVEDLQEIKKIVDTSFIESFGSVWEQNLEPAFEAIHSAVATKDDLKNFATKDDLKNFATKNDIVGVNSNLHNIADRLEIRIGTSMDSCARRDEGLLKRTDRMLDGLEKENVFPKETADSIREITILKPVRV